MISTDGGGVAYERLQICKHKTLNRLPFSSVAYPRRRTDVRYNFRSFGLWQQVSIKILKQESIPVGCVPLACQLYHIVSQVPCVWEGNILTPFPGNPPPRQAYSPPDTYTPPVNRMTDRRLCKHYLPATLLAGDNDTEVANDATFTHIFGRNDANMSGPKNRSPSVECANRLSTFLTSN